MPSLNAIELMKSFLLVSLVAPHQGGIGEGRRCQGWYQTGSWVEEGTQKGPRFKRCFGKCEQNWGTISETFFARKMLDEGRNFYFPHDWLFNVWWWVYDALSTLNISWFCVASICVNWQTPEANGSEREGMSSCSGHTPLPPDTGQYDFLHGDQIILILHA